jgi:hypothetical protein
VRARREGGSIVVRDRPGAHWALGLFLLAGGCVTMAAVLGLATNAATLSVWARLGCFAIGAGGSAGALWWLARAPASRTTIDLLRRRVQVARWGISGRSLRELEWHELAGMMLVVGTDSEGGTVVRPTFLLHSGEVVPLSLLWSHDTAGIETLLSELARDCQLSSLQAKSET